MSVFGALNRFISRLDDAPRPQSSGAPGDNSSFGFQILRNKNNEVLLEPWFDFIIGINGRQIENPDPNLFANEVRNCAGTSVLLMIWNAKGQRIREIYLPIPSPPSNLGLSLQWTPLSSTQNTWHILEVAPNSPADNAGLLPYGDYIIGTPEGLLHGEAALGELVEEYLHRPVRLYVYNHEYNVTRTVDITPSRSWGGEGALGCVLGYGHLHRIPEPLEEGGYVREGETMFNAAAGAASEIAPGRMTPPAPRAVTNLAANDDLSQFAMSPPKGDIDAGSASFGSTSTSNLITPASLPQPPMMNANAPIKSGRAPKKARAARNAGFDEMFAEGEKKSAAVDNAPRSKGAGVPPPPKTGGGLETPEGLRPETRSPDPVGNSDDGHDG